MLTIFTALLTRFSVLWWRLCRTTNSMVSQRRQWASGAQHLLWAEGFHTQKSQSQDCVDDKLCFTFWWHLLLGSLPVLEREWGGLVHSSLGPASHSGDNLLPLRAGPGNATHVSPRCGLPFLVVSPSAGSTEQELAPKGGLWAHFLNQDCRGNTVWTSHCGSMKWMVWQNIIFRCVAFVYAAFV